MLAKSSKELSDCQMLVKVKNLVLSYYRGAFFNSPTLRAPGPRLEKDLQLWQKDRCSRSARSAGSAARITTDLRCHVG